MFAHDWTRHVPEKGNVNFDGLGPVYNQTSCIGCHPSGGRGRPPQNADEPMETMVVRLSAPGDSDKPPPHSAYGTQLNDRALPGIPWEGRAIVTYDEVAGSYGDGTPYRLEKPQYRFADLAFGPLDGAPVSGRVAQPIIGLSLLESVPAAELESLADPDDADGDGISGRLAWLSDGNGRPVLGRFGWKADAPSIEEQAAEAAVNDIGLTNRLRREPNCPPVQSACVAEAKRPRTDISDRFFAYLVKYLIYAGAPQPRDGTVPEVKRGRQLFDDFRCAACHRPSLTAGGSTPFVEQRHRDVHAFTDLLLHDMGDGLADHRPEGAASGVEWRTAPLWGIGLSVNGNERFLHDGRARGLAEAILWHGGEAEKSREAFRNAPAGDRAALIAFLQSL
jgi:CxxC motif-containing protein (DUF1111 family)